MNETLRKVIAPPVDIELPVDLVAGELVYKTFQLAYDWHAVCAVKAATGKSMLETAVWDAIESDPEFVSAVLHAGLRVYQPEITSDDVKSMLMGGDFMSVVTKVAEAWQKSRPKPRPTQEPTETAAQDVANQ